LLDAAMGMTAFEAENAFALSLTTHRKFVPSLVFRQKAQLLEKSATLELSSFTERFSDLGGLDNLKAFSRRIAGSELARGILLVGVPGCGKSLFAKALGNELGIPTISMDFGRMFGSKVGESEERIRHAMNVVDAMSPCVLFIDELEKGIGGIASSNQSDGGTGSRVFGTFLTWLNDHKSRVFVVATTNNISHLPPEFLRAERWDGIFFVDLPTPEEQKEILGMHRKAFNLSEQETPDLTGWSGAEIRSMCRIAAMMDSSLKEAAKYIVPLSKSMSEQLDTLSKWAKVRAIPASKIPLPEPAQTARRRVVQTEEN
jgi:SpoVK/Ycf46/Vps4 family AAA+-type ATPase